MEKDRVKQEVGAMSQGFVRGWIVAAVTALWCPAMLAQEEKGATIGSNGMAEVQLKPTILRVEIHVLGDGKTLAAALEKLKGRREAAIEKLKPLGANPDSIILGKLDACEVPAGPTPCLPNSPVASDPLSSPTNLQPLPPPGNPPPAAIPASVPATDDSTPSPRYATPGTVSTPGRGALVTSTLTADWPLEANGPEAILLAVEKLKKRIGEAGLWDPTPSAIPYAPTSGLSPGTAYGAQSYSSSQPSPLMPVTPSVYSPSVYSPAAYSPARPLLYVARISPSQRETALAEAFAKAKNTAAELAKAAEGRLGPVVQISSYTGLGVTPAGVGEAEVSSPDPNGLLYRVQVTTQFRLLAGEK
jgi:hypothetical protein